VLLCGARKNRIGDGVLDGVERKMFEFYQLLAYPRTEAVSVKMLSEITTIPAMSDCLFEAM
jgi:hypothetical protein